MAIIKLKTSDEEVIEVDIEVAKYSKTIQSMLENCDYNEEDENVPAIPLSNINSMVLKRVFEWATYHKNNPTENDNETDETTKQQTKKISKWDEDFFKVDQSILFQIILAANFLDIKDLIDLGCRTVANLIHGKTPDDIRKLFNIRNDFTLAEEEQIRRENSWCEE